MVIPKKYRQILHTLKNINVSENPPKSEIQKNFEPPKMTEADVCIKISEYHPPGPWGYISQIEKFDYSYPLSYCP